MDLFSRDDIWAHPFPASLPWTLSGLVLALFLFFGLFQRLSSPKKISQNGVICPPEQLKDNLPNGVVNAYTLDREITVPFDIGDVRVSKLLIHPIKSCRGISLLESRYSPEGMENDRRWCVIWAESHAVVTAREVSKMVLITPSIEANPASPHGGSMVVSFPEDSGCEPFSVPLYPTEEVLSDWPEVDDCLLWGDKIQGYVCSSLDPSSTTRAPSEILSEYFGKPVYLVMKGPRPRPCGATLAFPDLQASAVFQDGYPYLIASEESLGEVSRVVNTYAHDERPEAKIAGIDRERWRQGGVNIERFRPNIVLRGSGVPFAEDMWRQVVIHPELPEAEPEGADATRTFTLVSKCTRCLLPNVDTTTGVRDAAVPYKVLLKFRKGKDPARMSKSCFGCNAVVGGEGLVRVGDRIEVKEWAGGIGV